MSPVPHSVELSWFLAEFIVLNVEIEDRNLVLALLRKISGSDGKNISFRFNYTPECMVPSMHFYKFSGEGSLSSSADFYPRSISGCVFDLGFALNSRALKLRHRSVRVSHSIHPIQNVYWPLPNRRGLDQTLFPNPNFLSSPTLDPKSRSKNT